VAGQRDYVEWHRAYDDPGSGLSWRLRAVQGHIRRVLDERPGPLRVLSACAGDGRDVLGVLAQRADAARVSATLVELHPGIAARAREAAAGVDRTIAAAPQLCAPGALLLWSRGRHDGDRNAAIRARFAAAGFAEVDYATRDAGSRPALGAVRYAGPATPLVTGARLFSFVR
jgi:hypothetical protein